ncbi:universal stress protein [Streptomyces sp. NPDC060333]|uniref:universal stress protein n=1 Tax=Streptomyces sp. NPDC060333 TaxID=3347098 RepID=UPI00365C80E5
MNDRIVVGLDGTRESVAAGQWAASEAHLHNAPLHLVHVEESTAPLDAPAPTADVRRHWTDALLSEAADDLLTSHAGVVVSTESIDGPPAASLKKAAEDASMLVLGSRGLGSLTGYILGSVAMAVVHTTERPVVLVRTDEDAEASAGSTHTHDRPLVVGLDLSRPCDTLLAFAFAEASLRDCALHAVYSWKLPPVAGYGSAYDPRVHAQLDLSARTNLSDVLRPWREKYPAIDVIEHASAGHPVHQLMEKASGAGLLIVGRRIRRSPVGAHIGPVTHSVIHHARVPVAVIAHRY